MTKLDDRHRWRSRRHPARGVLISGGQATIVFVTVCTKDRCGWLTQTAVHTVLADVWRSADAWLVGDYVLMPDHLHLFCAPRDLTVALKQWVAFWKRQFSCLHVPGAGAWQRDCWDTRLRRAEKYGEKWQYVRNNPVRKGLVLRCEDWPYQGRLNVLRW